MSVQNIRGSNPAENFFRKNVFFAKRPSEVIARISSDTTYELFLNGRLVLKVREWANVRDYDLTGFFQKGNNQIAVRAVNDSGHRGFAFELAADGVSVLVSDRTWKSSPEERWGWCLPDFDDSKWENAYEMDLSAAGGPQWSTLPGSNPKKVIPSLDACPFFIGDIPKCVDSPFYLRKKQPWTPCENAVKTAGPDYLKHTQVENPVEIFPQQIREIKPCTGTITGDLQKGFVLTAPERYTGPSFIVDFGREMVGFFRIRIQSEGRVSFRLYHAETMTEAVNEVTRDQLLNRMMHEEYRVGKGTQEFESRMRYAGRFMRVEFFDTPQTVNVSGISLRTELYNVQRRGYFHCSDPVLNQLWEMGERTLHFCMQEYYIDAPKRDRFLWVGDTRFEALFNYYLFADTDLFEFSWSEVAKVQYPTGEIPSAYGAGLSQLWDYTAMYVMAFQDYYLHTGKTEFLLKHKDTILRAVDYLTSKSGADGLIDVPENPMGNLWMVILNNTHGKDAIMNMYYLEALKCAKTVCELSADAARTGKYEKLIALTEPAVSKLVVEKPIDSIKYNWDSSTMLYEIVEKTAALKGVAAGLDLLREKWSVFIKRKCDCFGEGFYSDNTDSIEDIHKLTGNISCCHGWTAAPAQFCPKWIAGIRPLAPGFTRFSVSPAPAGLTHFECVVPTPHGEIALAFKDGSYSLSVPAGCTAETMINGKKNIFTEGCHSF